MNRFRNFRAHGKLLLTGEYLVLEGAQALAIPLKLGQSLQVRPMENHLLIWEAHCPQGLWFTATFQLPSLILQTATDDLLAKKLRGILEEAFLEAKKSVDQGVHVVTQLDFHPEYGFGSSATLISLLSQWLDLNAHSLHHALFGGSGYDIACATSDSPILYALKDSEPKVIPVHFYPTFHDNLYFVYLGKKQHSSSEIKRFKKRTNCNNRDIDLVSELTNELYKAGELGQFEAILLEHEVLMSRILDRPTIQEVSFSGYSGVVKSLGAWGGDFVLVTTHKSDVEFRKEMIERGFKIVYSFEQLVMR